MARPREFSSRLATEENAISIPVGERGHGSSFIARGIANGKQRGGREREGEGERERERERKGGGEFLWRGILRAAGLENGGEGVGGAVVLGVVPFVERQ